MLPVTNIQHFSTHDGDGIRTVVFLKGCPLHCFWCHNPETAVRSRCFYFYQEKCVYCGKCQSVCPSHNHSVCGETQTHVINDLCTSCAKCIEVCPTGAIKKSFSDMAESEILQEIMKDQAFYGEIGGVTLSGGEPMYYPKETLRLLEQCKNLKINTAIETCGYFDSKYLQPLSKVCDCVFWDFKDSDPQRHYQNTGVSNEKIIKNLFLADSLQMKIILRCILINGVNTTPQHINSIIQTANQLKNCMKIQIFPFHMFGESKYRALQRSSNYGNNLVPEPHYIQTVKEQLAAACNAVVE